jgi:hypothetical protein
MFSAGRRRRSAGIIIPRTQRSFSDRRDRSLRDEFSTRVSIVMVIHVVNGFGSKLTFIIYLQIGTISFRFTRSDRETAPLALGPVKNTAQGLV